MEMTLLIILMIGIEVFRPQRDLRSLLHNGMMAYRQHKASSKSLTLNLRVCEPNEPTNLQQPLEPRISFNDVTFQYPAATEATLHKLNINVEPGERIGIVGVKRIWEKHHRETPTSLLRPHKWSHHARRA